MNSKLAFTVSYSFRTVLAIERPHKRCLPAINFLCRQGLSKDCLIHALHNDKAGSGQRGVENSFSTSHHALEMEWEP